MPTAEEVDELIAALRNQAEPRGYHLNPNEEDLRVIIEGLLVNKEKVGYLGCPCRLNTGVEEEDRDIVCPCDYRDDDVNEFGACYCSLYVSEACAKGEAEIQPVPERRPAERPKKEATPAHAAVGEGGSGTLEVSTNVWRCPVCGYLAAKDEPPPKCPICGVDKDRFELFIKAG